MPNVRKFRKSSETECSVLGLTWVEILGTRVCGSLGTRLTGRRWLPSPPALWTAAAPHSGCLGPAGHGGLCFSALELGIVYFVATCLYLLGSVSPTRTIFVLSWDSWVLAEVYQMPGSILSCRGPDITKVPVRCWLGLGGSGELRQ